jgi:hypothetical protein
MNVRISAVISILALTAWLPIQAQQAATPNAPAMHTQTSSTPDEKSQDAAKHSCCHPEEKAGQKAASSAHDHSAMQCCQGKGTSAAKAACCAGIDAKDIAACCRQKDAAGKTAMSCCTDKKDTMCAAKDGKTCCSHMNAKDLEGCCTGKADHCVAGANGK